MPKFDWSVEKKNPLFYFIVVCFLGGMILAGWGWDKNESTIIERTHGAVPMMIVGGSMILVGLIGMFYYKAKRK